MSYISIVTPVIALVLGWLVRGERLTLWSLVGGALILLSVALALPAKRALPAAR